MLIKPQIRKSINRVRAHANSAHAENGDYFRFHAGENTFDRRLILRPTAKVGRIYPINLMTDIVGVDQLA